MYRVSPFTYLVSAVLSTGVGGATATCSDIEISRIIPPMGMTCKEYLGGLEENGMKLFNENATAPTACELCALSDTDSFLAQVNIFPDDVWRNVGILFAYIVINVIGAVLLYWLIRVPKKSLKKDKKKEA